MNATWFFFFDRGDGDCSCVCVRACCCKWPPHRPRPPVAGGRPGWRGRRGASKRAIAARLGGAQGGDATRRHGDVTTC